MRRILILGGTAEARQLAEHLAGREDVAAILSLAGRTVSPTAQPVPMRIGGFGGAQGLADYLSARHIDALIDATHPYAANMSANAVRAVSQAEIPFLALRRPPWMPIAGDRWIEVADVGEAVSALGTAPRRVFLTLGRKELGPFVGAPQHDYLVRSVDPVDPPLAVSRASYITARGPFGEADERALLEQRRIEIIVSKNSGGSATYTKIAAARTLGLPVVVLRRPALPRAPTVETVEEALAWLDHGSPRVARGV
jgi:precorrin-6A/cobalt-precorrin-6A reductase